METLGLSVAVSILVQSFGMGGIYPFVQGH